MDRHYLDSVYKVKCLDHNVLMQGLRSQKKRSLHGVNEHFFDERNEADGHYGQTLFMLLCSIQV